jgi:Tol biopolymer transport system component
VKGTRLERFSSVMAVLVGALFCVGCLGGSSGIKLGALVRPHAVAPELIAADSGHDLVLLAPDGSETGRLTPGGSLVSVDAPSWSPDGRSIVFTASRPGRVSNTVLLPPTDVYVIDATGRGLHRVTAGRNALYPQWSPDGRWIEYSKVTLVAGKRSAAIWIIHPDGSGAREITSAVANKFDLAGPYNPRSGTVAFTRCNVAAPLVGGLEPDTCGVWTMRPDGSQQRMLTRQSEQPAWSPSGRTIVFASARDHAGIVSVGIDNHTWIRQLYLMGADGNNQRRLLTTHTSDQAPQWAPGGNVLAYQTSTRQPDETVIAITNANGSCDRATVQPGDSMAWRPGGTVGRLTC